MPDSRSPLPARVAVLLAAIAAVGTACVAKAGVSKPPSAGEAAPHAPSAVVTREATEAAPVLAVAVRARTPYSPGARGKCPDTMANVDGRFCIDRWEASLLDVGRRGEHAHSPFHGVGKHGKVRAVSLPNVYPQAYVSRSQASSACQASGKRLCRGDEWVLACKGSAQASFPYGDERAPGTCNDDGKVSPLRTLYGRLGRKMYMPRPMNDPRLNQLRGTLSKTGAHEACTNEHGVYDMVGNVHEWVDEARSTFRGGYYLDTRINGEGCDYRTVAHAPSYHDYSTGFRCCSDVEGGGAPEPATATDFELP